MHIHGKKSFITGTYTDSKPSTHFAQEWRDIKNIKIIFTDCPTKEMCW